MISFLLFSEKFIVVFSAAYRFYKSVCRFPSYFDYSLDFVNFKTAYGTAVYACSAAGALSIINDRKIVNNGNGLKRAVLLAFHTADAGVFTFFAGNSAFFVIGAGNDGLFRFGNERNDMIRAGFCAHSAAYAFFRVDARDSVYHANCVILALFGTVAAS